MQCIPQKADVRNTQREPAIISNVPDSRFSVLLWDSA